MAVELKVPSAGESITEVQIGMWLKNEGDTVQVDDPIVEIDTDKVSMEVTAPVSGTISKVLIQSGESAQVGDVIAMIEEGEVAASQPAAASAPAPKADPSQSAAPAPAPAAPSAAPPPMPAAQRALAEKGMQASQVQGSGRGGQVLKEDVERAASAPAPSAPAPAAPRVSGGNREEDVVQMTPLRKTIAKRLVQSQQDTATLTTYNEIDMSRVMHLRSLYKESFKERYGVNLGFMSFFVKASVDALKLIPSVNAEMRGDSVVYKNYHDIGVAVGGGKGLVVPIIRNAERLSFSEIELTIGDFGRRARENKIKLEEMQGGTFTISNGGVYGSMLSTPILNSPQTGILGMHNIQKRAVVVDDQIVIRPMMYVALSYDHRVIDGREAVTFLKRIKEVMESPDRMLIEI